MSRNEGRKIASKASQLLRRVGRYLLPLVVLLSLLHPATGAAMITTGQVFADPQVAQLANAAQDGDQMSLLQEAIMGRNLPVVRLLVERGANINYVHPISGSALHYALDGIDFYIPAYLVEAGIDLKLLDGTAPEITNPRARRQTAIEYFCETEGGRRGDDPLPEIAAGWRVFTAALARRGVKMPCGL